MVIIDLLTVRDTPMLGARLAHFEQTSHGITSCIEVKRLKFVTSDSEK